MADLPEIVVHLRRKGARTVTVKIVGAENITAWERYRNSPPDAAAILKGDTP